MGVVAAGTPLKALGDRGLTARGRLQRGGLSSAAQKPPEVGAGRGGVPLCSPQPHSRGRCGRPLRCTAGTGSPRCSETLRLSSTPLSPTALRPRASRAGPHLVLRGPSGAAPRPSSSEPPPNSNGIPPRAQGPLWKAQVDPSSRHSHSPFPPPFPPPVQMV